MPNPVFKMEIDKSIPEETQKIIRSALQIIAKSEEKEFVSAMICSMMQRCYFLGCMDSSNSALITMNEKLNTIGKKS
jgi:hypothetical protein